MTVLVGEPLIEVIEDGQGAVMKVPPRARILVIDDNPAVADILITCLSEEGHGSRRKHYRLCITGVGRPGGFISVGMFGVSTATRSRLPGRLRLIPLGVGMPLFHPLSLMNHNRSVFGVNLGHLWHEVDKIRQWMRELLRGVEDGRVRPHVDRSFPLDQAGQAQAYLEARRNVGKVVLTTLSS